MSCNESNSAELLTGSDEIITVRMAITSEDQAKGLSGVKEHQFAENEGMLFYYEKAGPRSFWMPDTYFDLDLFFLDKDLNVLAIHRGLKAHPGRQEPPVIERTEIYYCRHVLEMKHSSAIAKKIKRGDKLKWKSFPSYLKK